MNPVEIIMRKRDGEALSQEQITYFIRGYTDGAIPDYQMSALAMAIYFQGMTDEETGALTDAMLHSGTTLSWSDGGPPKVDKHSTGGIGDKVSILLAPLLATCGLQVPMISGRGLGATGGTLDKLESIPGFRTDLTIDEMRQIADDVGCVICGASQHLAPADRKLYALRDVTGTVPSIPLITASIMSKKLAEGLDALVLDVKFGSGAFMKTKPQAQRLADSLVQTGKRMGVACGALLTDMQQPLGRAVGNAIEVNESVHGLRGEGPPDLMRVTLALGAEALLLAGGAPTQEAARALLQAKIDSGHAYEKLVEMVQAQGGQLSGPLPLATESPVLARNTGVIRSMNAEALGWAIIDMGGGRKIATDSVDPSVGFEMQVRIGERVTPETPIARLFCPKELRGVAASRIQSAMVYDG